MAHIRWSPDEINLLKELYPKIRIKDLAKSFPRRNRDTIVAKALELRLHSAKLWHPHENSILKKHFKLATKEKIIEYLPKRSWGAILAQGERLGLKRKLDKPRQPINEDYFKRWSSDMAYILGFILADGCIVKGTYSGYSDMLKFGVALKDCDILNKIKLKLSSEHKVSRSRNAYFLSIASQNIVNDLKKLGIIYRKSLRETIPKIPNIYTRDFIRGIIDGDGSLSIDKSGYPTLSVAGGKNTLKFIRNDFFTRFKLYSHLAPRTYSKSARSYLYNISYRCNSAKKIIEYLYTDASLYLNRKYAIAIKCSNIKIGIRNNEKYRLKRYNETYNS